SLGVRAPRPDASAAIGEPRTGFLDDAGGYAEIQQFAGLRYAFAVHDVEFDLLEGRRHPVLDAPDAGLVAALLLAVLDRPDAADVETDGGIEFEGIAARRGLGGAEHDADLHADLVDEDHHALRLGDRCGELAERLAHEPRLHAGKRIAHPALELGARRECRYRIDDQNLDGAGAHQRVADFERL